MRKYISILLLLFIFSCEKKDVEVSSKPSENLSDHFQKEGILMQAFYWDVEPRGEWWNTIEPKLATWKELGVDKIWLPPASKGMSGGYSMGYDPFDYFDFGDFDQMGTTKTRFGSRVELEKLITKAHSLSIDVIADVVLNHNSGGQTEFNPYRQKNTYTKFEPKSGKFNRSFEDFHPNSFHTKDAEALFFEEQDLCHDQENVQNWFWKNEYSVAKYYKNVMKFDGWRFDYVKGFAPDVISNYMKSAGGFGILEVWDGNADLINSWVDKTGISAFDFAAFYAMENAFDGFDLRVLVERPQLWKMKPDRAYTFVNNHDTAKETNPGNKLSSKESTKLAYAYMLTHPGNPCIFYLDYEEVLDKSEIKKLCDINRSLAFGDLKILEASKDSYVAQRSGNETSPGLVIHINNTNAVQEKVVTTQWKNSTLFNYSGYGVNTLRTNDRGQATIKTAAKSYSIWSLNNF
ncbi:alpha-amylase [Spirosomataceae bacterium TFI 002]|nr:alpha-amylase [Spirosomataceae bacterium TFI 002]